MRPDVAAWLARTRADAEARGLPALTPLLEGLARSTAALRDSEIAGPEGPAYGDTAGGTAGPAGEDTAAGPAAPADTPDAGDAAS